MSGLPPPPPAPPVRPEPSADAARAHWVTASDALEATMARVRALSDEDRHRRVDGEWSAVESLRHIVLVVDLWLSRIILGVEDPFHPMALPPSFMPPKLPGSSIDPEARPSFDEACAVVRDRLAAVGAYVEGLADDDLSRPVDAHAKDVGGALGVLFDELDAHTYFMNRDLAAIEA